LNKHQLKKAFFFVAAIAFASLKALSQNVEPYEPGEGLHITNEKDYSIRLSGFFQPMMESRFYPGMTGKKDYQRFRMRRMIAKLTGEAKEKHITYQLQVDLTGSSDGGGDATTNNYLMDAWVGWKANKHLEIVVGQENSPTDSREMGMISTSLQMIDRSPVALAFSSIREFGVFVNTEFKAGQNGFILPSIALTNGDGANVFAKDHGGMKIGGRLDFLPFGKFGNGGQFRQTDMERELTPKLVFGATYSYNSGISDRRGRQSGTVLYLDSLGNETLPDYQKFGFDFLFKYRGLSVLGEFIRTSAVVPKTISQRVRADGTTATTFLVNGLQNVPNYVKARMMLGKGFNVQIGYLFTNGFSIDARYTKLKADPNSFLNNGTFYNRPDFYSLCASRYLGRNYGAKLQASVTWNKANAGSLTVTGKPLAGNELSGTIMLTFSL
jgi:Phosphate-selective porin O and P